MRIPRALGLALLPALILALSCEREERPLHSSPAASSRVEPVRVVNLQPGQPLGGHELKSPYEDNAYEISEGKRLFDWYNCSGCHSHGGGGMGPPLMDDEWIYGSQPKNIYDTIVEGRPNGMPSFGGHLPNDQIWQLVAYVRSLGQLTAKSQSPTRSDHLYPGESEQMREGREEPKRQGAEHP